MKPWIKTIFRYALYLAVLWLVVFSFYYSYWSQNSHPKGFWLDLYYGMGCLILLILIKPTRGLSWLLLPSLYLFANGILHWGNLNFTALNISVVVSILMALLHIFWIFKSKSNAA